MTISGITINGFRPLLKMDFFGGQNNFDPNWGFVEKEPENGGVDSRGKPADPLPKQAREYAKTFFNPRMGAEISVGMSILDVAGPLSLQNLPFPIAYKEGCYYYSSDLSLANGSMTSPFLYAGITFFNSFAVGLRIIGVDSGLVGQNEENIGTLAMEAQVVGPALEGRIPFFSDGESFPTNWFGLYMNYIPFYQRIEIRVKNYLNDQEYSVGQASSMFFSAGAYLRTGKYLFTKVGAIFQVIRIDGLSDVAGAINQTNIRFEYIPWGFMFEFGGYIPIF